MRSEALAFLEAMNLPEKPQVDRDLDGLLAHLGIGSDVEADTVAAAWRRFLELDSSATTRETFEHVALLGALHRLSDPERPGIDDAFRRARLQLERSRTEIALRLASRLFMMGRRRKLTRTPNCTALLQTSITYFDLAEEKSHPLQPHHLKKLYGMRGVAGLFLARDDGNQARLRQSLSDVTKSIEYGNQTAESYKYRREILVRICDEAIDEAIIQDLASTLDASEIRDRQYYSDHAKLSQARSRLDVAGGVADRTHLLASIEACNDGLASPGDGDTPDEVFYNLRGFAHFLLFQQTIRADRDDALEHLNLAIGDLAAAQKAGLGGASLSQALLRRASLRKSDEQAEAVADLEAAQAALSLAGPEVAERLRREIAAGMADYEVRRQLENIDSQTLEEAARRLIGLGEEARWHGITVLNAVRALIRPSEGSVVSDELRALAESAVDLVSGHLATLDQGESIVPVLCQHLGALCFQLDKPASGRRAVEFFRQALEASDPPTAELWGRAANAELQFGKRCSKEGDAVAAAQFFEDAVNHYKGSLQAFARDPESVAAGYQAVVIHSRLGEANLRLRAAGGGSDETTNDAIKHFQLARDLGNNSAELSGLLADAYYRRGYNRGDEADLNEALRLKLAAQAGGHASRESASVRGRVNQRLYEIRKDPALIEAAIVEFLEAARLSPDWPWPFFQLADLARFGSAVVGPAVENVMAALGSESPVATVLGQLAAGDRTGLLAQGVTLAINNKEFRQKVLGGRSKVFVLEDPHGLLSTTLVLKPTDRSNAEREVRTTRELFKELRARGVEKKLLVPHPIAIVEGGTKEVIYAMERARAQPLGRVLLGSDLKGYPIGHDLLRRALEFLTVFHQVFPVEHMPPRLREGYVGKFQLDVARATGAKSLSDDLQTAVRAIVPDRLHAVRKKDAHPENWLVTERGGVVMIDLEGSQAVPALLDVAQLVDDYPALPPNEAGWTKRLELANQYAGELIGADADPDWVEKMYTACVLHRCAFGTFYCRKESKTGSSSSALEAFDIRIEHYQALSGFLEQHSPNPLVRRVAAVIRSGDLS